MLCGMSDDGRARVLKWLKEQGYWLEHSAARTARSAGFLPAMGRVYTDTETGKLRDIDVVAHLPGVSGDLCLERYVAVECKAANTGAWVVRRAPLGRNDYSPIPIATVRAAEFLTSTDSFRRTFGIGSAVGFSVVIGGAAKGEAPKREQGQDPAFSTLRQAVSAARGVVQNHSGSAFAYPVVVITAPLYSLEYATDEPTLTPERWARVLFSGSHELGAATPVDVVRHDALRDYLLELRETMSELCYEMRQQSWDPDDPPIVGSAP
jgi:hypothetical protein